jgi:hypothetical protein
MADEPTLADKARAAIRNGRLPARAPNRRFGGRGNGVACPVCGEVVTPDLPEIEIEFNRHGPTLGLDRYHLHARCFTVWESERRKIPGPWI